VVDHDELRSGRHREGLYFGVWKMGMKLARAGGLVLAGVLLEAIGLGEGSPVVPPGAVRGLAWIFGPGVGGLFVAGALVFVCFPLSDARHRRVQALLKRRQARR
jgi:GPH family glycoside/pentoside/hexuronide:cation symporter